MFIIGSKFNFNMIPARPKTSKLVKISPKIAKRVVILKILNIGVVLLFLMI
jgi:hypothetical protein